MKTYLITGVSSGIGKAIAKLVLDTGHRVIGLGRNAPVWHDGEALEFIQVDLSDPKATEVCFEQLKRRKETLDAVVSNAGVGVFGQLENLKVDQIQSAMHVNLTAHILLARALLPSMKTHRRGTFVLMGSESALRGGKNGGVYCAAKFGLRGLAQSLRADCARSGVRVAIVHPGMVDTAFFDALWFRPGSDDGQALAPEDVAQAVLSICEAPEGTVIDEISLSPQVKAVAFDKRG